VLSESAAVLRSRRQVVTMLVAVVFFFFACIMPFKVLTLWIVTSPTEIFDVVSEETYFNLVKHLDVFLFDGDNFLYRVLGILCTVAIED
jgi:hypothetical protein